MLSPKIRRCTRCACAPMEDSIVIVTLSGAKDRLRAGLSSWLNNATSCGISCRRVEGRVQVLERRATVDELRRAHTRAVLDVERPSIDRPHDRRSGWDYDLGLSPNRSDQTATRRPTTVAVCCGDREREGDPSRHYPISGSKGMARAHGQNSHSIPDFVNRPLRYRYGLRQRICCQRSR